MRPQSCDTPMLWLRRGLYAGALGFMGACAVFLLLRSNLDTMARTGINAEIGRIAGEHAALSDGAAVILRPDLRVVVPDPILDFGPGHRAVTLGRMDATLRPTPLLKGQVKIASLQLDRPHFAFDDLDMAAFLNHWSSSRDDAHAPARIEVTHGVIELAEALHLSDLNMRISQQGTAAGVLVQGDFVVGARRAIVELHVDDPQQAVLDTGSAGRLSIRFEKVAHEVYEDTRPGETDAHVLTDLLHVVDGFYLFGRRPLVIDGHFAVTPGAIHIFDASFSLGAISLSGDLELRARSDAPVLLSLLAFPHFGDTALSELRRHVNGGTWTDAPIRVDWINPVDVDLTLSGQDIAVGEALFDAVSLSVVSRGTGVVLDTSADSETLGRFSSRTSMTNDGHFEVWASLSDASVSKLARPIARRMQARLIGSPQLPEGALDASLHVSGHGATLGALFNTLSGSMTASLQDGSLSGADVTATLQSLANGREFMTKEKGPLIPAAGRTHFDQIDGEVGIEAGTARISRLTIEGERLAIEMLGEVGLTSGAVSVVGNAKLSAADGARAAAISRDVDLPFGIGGTVFTPMVAAGVPQFETAAHDPPG